MSHALFSIYYQIIQKSCTRRGTIMDQKSVGCMSANCVENFINIPVREIIILR